MYIPLYNSGTPLAIKLDNEDCLANQTAKDPIWNQPQLSKEDKL